MDRDKRLVAHSRQIFSRATYSGATSPVSAGDSGLTYATGVGILRAFNSLGTVEWEVPFAQFVPPTPGSQAAPQLTQPVIGPGERLYVGAETATWALDKTGRILWQAPAGAARLGVSSNGVFALSAFGDLARLSFNGAVLARTNLNAYIQAFAITPDENLLIAAQFGTNSLLRCLDDSFREIWHYAAAAAPQSLVVRKDGLILAGGWQTDLLDPAGKVLWTRTNDLFSSDYSIAAAASTDLFYVYERGSEGVNLSAFSADGSRRWARPVGGLGSAVALADGSVISAAPNPSGTSFRLGTILKRFGPGGETLWETAAPWYQPVSAQGPPWFTPTIVVDGKGNLYLPAAYTFVFAVDSTPANSGWPMWFGDWRNAGHPEPLPGSVVPTELGLFLTLNPDNLELFVSAPPQTEWTLQNSTNLVEWTELTTPTNVVEISASSLGKSSFFRVLKK